MDLTKLFEIFFANSKTNVMFVVGVVLLAAGVLGKTFSKKEDDRWRTLAVVFGASLMILGPAISFLQSQAANLPGLLKNNLAVIFVLVLGVWAFAGAVLVQVQMNRLVNHEKRLIASVEDATRHVLLGLPQIFDRAYQLISEAEDELWIISFALNFGACHSQIPAVAAEYSKLPMNNFYRSLKRRRTMATDVASFLETLRKKVVDIPKVHILTLFDEAIMDNFLEPLAGRPGYGQIFEDKKNELYGQVQRAKAGIMERMQNGRDKSQIDTEHSCGLYQIDTLPLQLFIAGAPKGKTGCLVFMVGTEILQAAKSKVEDGDKDNNNKSVRQDKQFQEPGFYTELTEVVDVYRSLAEALFTQARKQSKPDRNVVVYEYPSP
jgi:hypothetical protein